MARRALPAVVLLLLAGAFLTGCAGAKTTSSGVPESASLAPADALAFATVTTDAGSDQWQQAASLLERIPGLRDGLSGSVASGLGEQGLDWSRDVAPALGPELVVVATADRQPVVLVLPDDPAALDRLLANGDTAYVRGTVDGWQALAQTRSALDAYRASLDAGTLEGVDRFTAGFGALPADSLVRAWVDTASLSEDIAKLVEQPSSEMDLGLDWLSLALTAKDDGLLLTLGMRTPGSGDTRYEPTLFARIPADAVAAVSFGGTQKVLDRVEGSIDVDGISKQIERFTGVPLERLLDALSGEGAVYVRKGGKIPEVTLVLAPPDPDKTWGTLRELAGTLAEQSSSSVTVRTEDGREVHQVASGDVTVSFARLDERTVIVTTGADGIRAFASDGPKLVDSDGYTRAADAAGATPGDRTRGLVYVDVDGLLPLVEAASGATNIPTEARDVLSSIDAFLLQGTGEGDTTQVSGFLRVND